MRAARNTSELRVERDHRSGRPSQQSAHPLARLVRRAWVAYWRWQTRRATVQLLEAMDDHVLRDLGIRRNQIHLYARGQRPHRSCPSCEDGERHCRMFCHPIRTGIDEVMVRPIGPRDADMAQGFVGSLSATSRYFRFFQTLRGLSPGMLERFTCVDHRTHMALVGIAHVQGQQSIIAEARYALNDDGATADIAVAVTDTWQRRGVASGLLDMLERIAAATGVTRLTGESFAVNETFLSFARAFGFRIRPDDTDRRVLRIEKQIGECTVIRLGGRRRDPGG